MSCRRKTFINFYKPHFQTGPQKIEKRQKNAKNSKFKFVRRKIVQAKNRIKKTNRTNIIATNFFREQSKKCFFKILRVVKKQRNKIFLKLLTRISELMNTFSFCRLTWLGVSESVVNMYEGVLVTIPLPLETMQSSIIKSQRRSLDT